MSEVDANVMAMATRSVKLMIALILKSKEAFNYRITIFIEMGQKAWRWLLKFLVARCSTCPPTGLLLSQICTPFKLSLK